MSSSSPSLLVAGCGYIGAALARMAGDAGWSVTGLTNSTASAARLAAAGIDARALDLTDPAALAALARTLPPDIAVVHCAASGRGGGSDAYRTVYLEGMRRLREAFPHAARTVFTSSTSVYAGIDGGIVTEASPAEPDRETGRILRQTEDETLAGGGGVLRFAGLYGPGRSVLLRNFLTGQAVIDVRTDPPATPDGRWINQIHRHDAAAALLHVLSLPDNVFSAGRLWNAADSTPLLQRPLYTELARRFGRPLPPEAAPDSSRKRGWTHKRVGNAALRATGWSPRYPSWFDALDHDPEFLPSILRQVAEAADTDASS